MPEVILWSDTETASTCDLKSAGTAKYAEHSSTRVQLFSYAFNEDSVHIWSPEDREIMPIELEEAFEDPSVILQFHNVFFDRSVLIATKNHLRRFSRRKKDWNLDIERFRCSMAQALSHGLPGGLEKLGEVLGIREEAKKIADGHRLVRLFCKPCGYLKDGVTYKWNTPETHPEDWARYKEYCVNDVAAMREIVKKIPKFNYPGNAHEVELWRADQRINNRGMSIDLDLANKTMSAITNAKAELSCSAKEMTDGAVQNATQRDAMMTHIFDEFGIELPDMKKATVTRFIEDENTPPDLRDLLEVRLGACTTSTAKYKRILQTVSDDGRIRGTIQFAGASRTLRDGGRNTQPQNYPSRGLMSVEDTKFGIEAIRYGMEEIFSMDVMALAKSMLRYTIIASPGKKLLVSDLANIEGRVLSYLAGERWKLDAFRAYDEGTGPDLYKLAYAKAFGVKVSDVTKEQRNAVGKVMELAFGYGGASAAVVTFAISFGLDLSALAEQILLSVPEDVLKEAKSFFAWMEEQDIAEARAKAKKVGASEDWTSHYEGKRTCKLLFEQFVAFESLKRLWRREHPATVAFWKATEEACRNAIEVPNKNFYFGNNCFARRSGKWVRLVLPSGHALCYPGMEVGGGTKLFKITQSGVKKLFFVTEEGTEKSNTGYETVEAAREAIEAKAESGSLTKVPLTDCVEAYRIASGQKGLRFKGVHPTSKKWGWIYTHGGRLSENLSQAFARDIFKYGQLEAENQGYSVILPVHDELVCEVPDTDGYSVHHLEEIMATVPPWAEGIPLAAEGFSDYAYHK